MIVDANVNAEKDNFFMTNLLQDQVTVDEQGNATHQMTLDFNFPQSDHTEKFDFGHLDINYWEWMRVYVPPGSTVVTMAGASLPPTPNLGARCGPARWDN